MLPCNQPDDDVFLILASSVLKRQAYQKYFRLDPSFELLSTKNKIIQEEIVNKHNDLRANVSPPARNMLKMKWNPEAQELAQSRENGENLFMSTIPIEWPKVIQDWYDEVSNFDYEKGRTNPKGQIEHYSQIVWYSSFKVICAMAHCPDVSFWYYYVYQYCPGGNYRPDYFYEIRASCDKCPDSCSNNLCTHPCLYTNKFANCEDLKNQVSCQHEFVKNNYKVTCQ
ncbi:cysteine-rich secretory protein 3-like [Monodelphis domestica]|uniref:cysteine-rich secretory protein 3-like n=1 Tax=Monodelphis domestica TaxID=13616 RepID=UPI0024E1F8F7|nr:cysteine-rich secretory protein 3-like [Monodelphis domestica]